MDYEAPPAMSLGYDNLLFPFVIIIGGTTIAGKGHKTINSIRILFLMSYTMSEIQDLLHNTCRYRHPLRGAEIHLWQTQKRLNDKCRKRRKGAATICQDFKGSNLQFNLAMREFTNNEIISYNSNYC